MKQTELTGNSGKLKTIDLGLFIGKIRIEIDPTLPEGTILIRNENEWQKS